MVFNVKGKGRVEYEDIMTAISSTKGRWENSIDSQLA
jgi:hypothetical protein